MNQVSSKKFTKLKQWWMFGVAITILPLIGSYLGQLFFLKGFSLVPVFGKGQLLLVCIAISASALGELLSNEHSTTEAKITGGGGSACIIFLGTVLFGMASIPESNHSVQHSPLTLTIFSIILFVLTLLSSRGCIMASEAEAPE